MPNVKGAAAAVIGNILSVDNTYKFDDAAKKATTEIDGAKVMVGTRDGIAVVKVDAEQLKELRPVLYGPFAGLVRYGAWAGRGGSGEETCRYVGPVDQSWTDLLSSTLGAIKNAGTQKAAA